MALDGLPSIVCIADDVIIHGKDLEAHDRNLIAFMERCRYNGIKLKREKTTTTYERSDLDGASYSKRWIAI